MKKVLINILIIVTFLIIYLLQVNLFSNFRIAGIMPNIFVIFILFIGLFCSRIIGISAIMLGTVGLIGAIFDKNFSKESRLTIMTMVIVCTIIYELGSYLIGYVIYNYNLELISFIKILAIECLYNVIITIILYPLIKGLGYKIEEEYKGNKILTRYF